MKSKALKNTGLTFLFIFLLLFFTLLKLPQARITGLIQGYVQVALDPYGIFLSDRGRDLSILRGLRYKLDHPTLELADQTRIELDDLSVAPSFLSLLSGKMGVSADLHQGTGEVHFSGAGRGDKIDMNVDLDQVDIGKFGLLSYAAGLKGSGTISGNIQIAGALATPASLTGQIELKIKGLKLEEQNLMGFQIPSMNISEGTISAEIKGGKFIAKKIQLGKKNDDLLLTLTGDITLNRYLNASGLNLKTNFSLSDKVKQSLAILDSILSGAKLPDGRYAYKLTGTLSAPFPTPDLTP